jgi:thiamine biosynthesis lipoprotein
MPIILPQHFSYESMGTHWAISIWDTLDPAVFAELQESIIQQSQAFSQLYSRFNKSSLIWELTEKRGMVEVPKELIQMLRLYETLHDLSDGKCNPLVGFALSDLGYDADYSLQPKEHIRSVPNFHDALRLVDDTHLELSQSVLIDLGALGKGFFVDIIRAFLEEKGIQRFLVDGSGDMYYQGNGEVIRVGLEHPGDATKVIGVLEMQNGAMCGSASNSTEGIIATWVRATSAAVADGLATCVFLVEPERFENDFAFDYCLLNTEYKIKRSAGFTAELF